MDFQEPEVVRFFSCLNQLHIKYIIVGGLAVNVHGFNRSTGDADLWLLDDEHNRNNFVLALSKYGIEGAEIFHTLPFIAGYTEIVLDNGYVIDVMADLQFFKQNDFNACYAAALNFELNNSVSLRVIHLNTLITEKEKSKREKDNFDARELKRINKIQ